MRVDCVVKRSHRAISQGREIGDPRGNPWGGERSGKLESAFVKLKSNAVKLDRWVQVASVKDPARVRDLSIASQVAAV